MDYWLASLGFDIHAKLPAIQTHYKIVQKIRQATRKKVSVGDRVFSVVEPKYWNELPDDVRNIEYH